MERIWIFMKITEDIIYAGVNDHQVDLFDACVWRRPVFVLQGG